MNPFCVSLVKDCTPNTKNEKPNSLHSRNSRLVVCSKLFFFISQQILVFELHHAASKLSFCAEPDLGETIQHKTIVPAAQKAQLFAIRNITKLGDWVWNVIRLFVK